jgi:hypothetical protein
MRRARPEGIQIGRRPLDLDQQAIIAAREEHEPEEDR